MCNSLLLVILLLFILFYAKKIKSIISSEGLSSKPTTHEANQMASQIMERRELFDNGTLNRARNNIAWLDAITYEELRELSQRNNLTHHAVKQLLI